MSPNPSNPRIPEIRSQDFRATYASHVRLEIGPFDFILTFGQICPESPAPELPPRIVIRQNTAVTLTPEFARELADLLGQSLARYTERYGPLRPPLSSDPLSEAGPQGTGTGP